jgi:hypothetical protein
MKNLNEKLFTEISSQEAEVIQGGSKFTGYDSGGYEDEVKADRGIPNLKHPNTIEQVYITEGKWQLYDSDDYKNPIGDPIGPTDGKWLYLPKNQRDKANSILNLKDA